MCRVVRPAAKKRSAGSALGRQGVLIAAQKAPSWMNVELSQRVHETEGIEWGGDDEHALFASWP